MLWRVSNQFAWRDGKYLTDMLLAAERAQRRLSRLTQEKDHGPERVQRLIELSCRRIAREFEWDRAAPAELA
jgi:hypothetical protein